jgi:hypothetical protein
MVAGGTHSIEYAIIIHSGSPRVPLWKNQSIALPIALPIAFADRITTHLQSVSLFDPLNL